MATTEDIFVASPEGFRSQNIDRPPAHLVRELVQNSLDEAGVTKLDVTVTYHGVRQGTTVRVTDNAPQGVTDPKLLFTIWLSNKEDSPVKRGRMGRGFKEIVSVANETTIRSAGMDAMRFTRAQGGRWERKTLPKLGRTETGTEVDAFCRAWGEPAAKSIVQFIKRVRAPSGIALRVAYVDRRVMASHEAPVFEDVVPFTATETYDLRLPTVIYEVDEGDRKARDRERLTKVECFTPPPGEAAYIYELGIPVEECKSSPVSMDVQQRVILRERRDTVTDSYRRQLFAAVLDRRVEANLITGDDLRSNATLTAAQNMYALSSNTRKLIAEAWTGGLPFATGKDDYQRATGHHIDAILLRTLPEAIREVVKYAGTNVTSVLDARKEEFCPELKSLSPEADKLVRFWQWLSEGLNRPTQVRLCAGKPGSSADFDRNTQTLTLYAEELGEKFFADSAGEKQLGLFLHELAHWAPRENEHGIEFHSDAENIGGKLAAFMLNNAEQARLLLKAGS